MLLPTRQVNSKHCQAHSVINTVNCLVHLVAQFTEEGRLMQEVSSTPTTSFLLAQCHGQNELSQTWSDAVCKLQIYHWQWQKKSGSYHQDHARPFRIALKYTFRAENLLIALGDLEMGLVHGSQV